MGLDNFDFTSTAYNRWLRHASQGVRGATGNVPATAIDASTGRVIILDTAANRKLLQRLLRAG